VRFRGLTAGAVVLFLQMLKYEALADGLEITVIDASAGEWTAKFL
jgi:hypothetical protein